MTESVSIAWLRSRVGKSHGVERAAAQSGVQSVDLRDEIYFNKHEVGGVLLQRLEDCELLIESDVHPAALPAAVRATGPAPADASGSVSDSLRVPGSDTPVPLSSPVVSAL